MKPPRTTTGQPPRPATTKGRYRGMPLTLVLNAELAPDVLAHVDALARSAEASGERAPSRNQVINELIAAGLAARHGVHVHVVRGDRGYVATCPTLPAVRVRAASRVDALRLAAAALVVVRAMGERPEGEVAVVCTNTDEPEPEPETAHAIEPGEPT